MFIKSQRLDYLIKNTSSQSIMNSWLVFLVPFCLSGPSVYGVSCSCRLSVCLVSYFLFVFPVCRFSLFVLCFVCSLVCFAFALFLSVYPMAVYPMAARPFRAMFVCLAAIVVWIFVYLSSLRWFCFGWMWQFYAFVARPFYMVIIIFITFIFILFLFYVLLLFL